MPTAMIGMQILINLSIILMESVDEVYFYIRENSQGILLLRGVFGLSLLLLTGMLAFRLNQSDAQAPAKPGEEEKPIGDQIQLRHLMTCIMACLHSLSMMLHAQSKVKDAE